jgi:hypothetical protein
MSAFASDTVDSPIDDGRPGASPAAVAVPDDYHGLWEMCADSLRGPRARLVKAALVKGGLFYAFGVYCAVQAIMSTDVRAVVLWSLGVLWSIAVVVAVKLWWWMEMNRKSTLRCLARMSAHEPSTIR